jgi:DedD protein
LESSEREPSYYEVALTHRQLMVGLVVALTTVVVAFLAGVWIGRGGGTPGAGGRVAAVTPTADGGTQVDQITFFGEKKEAAKAAPKPTPIAPKPAAAPPAPTQAETEADALRKTLEAEMEAHRVEGTAPAAPGAASPVAAGTRVTRDAAASAPTATPTRPSAEPKRTSRATETTKPAPAAGTLWIQVYSSTNRERAAEISARLKKSGFAVRTLEPTTESGPNVRVRVGPYSDRARADRDASRLRREFRLDTWVTDAP